jgi:hypothetical protein
MLPYVDPIGIKSRRDHLSSIRQILERCKALGLKYATEDVRWRHVGIRNNEIYLFDLGFT